MSGLAKILKMNNCDWVVFLFWISSYLDTLTYTWDIYAVSIYTWQSILYIYTRIYVELSMIISWHIAAGTFELFGITNVCNSGHHVEALVEVYGKYRNSNTPAEGRWWRKLFACSEARGPTNQLVSNLNQDPSRWLNRIYSYSWLLSSLLDNKKNWHVLSLFVSVSFFVHIVLQSMSQLFSKRLDSIFFVLSTLSISWFIMF